MLNSSFSEVPSILISFCENMNAISERILPQCVPPVACCVILWKCYSNVSNVFLLWPFKNVCRPWVDSMIWRVGIQQLWSLQTFHCTVGFWCQKIHKKFLLKFDTIFGLKRMVKSGLEKIILRFHDGLQSCCCPVQKNLPRKAELAWQVSRYLWRPPLNFKIFFSKTLFTIILCQNILCIAWH